MAQRGAHLTANVTTKPSIFEIVAQDSLNSTFKPAIKRLIQFLYVKNPERFSWLELYFEEIYLGFNFFLQGYNIHYNSASYSENFYGLIRLNLNRKSLNTSLTNKQKLISLLTLVILPYLKTKWDRKIDQMKLEEIDGNRSNTINNTTRRKLIRSHQIVHFLMESAQLIQYLRYMSGQTVYAKPSLWVANVCLNYCETRTLQDRAWHLLKTFSLGKLLSLVLSESLQFAAFFFHFLHWWNQEPARANLTSLPIPDPPPSHQIDKRFLNICPICYKKRRIDTCLPVSGYLFCFECISQYVDQNGHCPVTKYPATSHDLIRIYKND